MEKHRAYFELLDRAKKPGCPVCASVAHSLKSYLDAYLYESVTDRDIWQKLQDANGYCPRHSRMLETFSDGLAVSLFYRHLLRLRMGELKPGPHAGPGLVGRLLGRREPAAAPCCPACAHEAEVEGQQCRLFAQAVDEPEFWAAWSARAAAPGESLCLPHLRGVLGQAGAEAGARLLELERGRAEALALQLDEYVRKSDHTVQEKFGVEADAWKRALGVFRGSR